MILSHARRVFFAAVVGQTTTVGTATTYTGLCLTNPVGSGVNLVLTNVGAAFSVAFSAAAAVGLMQGLSTTAVTHTTPVTPTNQINAGTGKALVDSAATLPATPVVARILDVGLTGAITTTPGAGGNFAIQEGEIVVPPGGFLAVYTSTASGTNGGNFSFTWEEQPLA